MTQHHRGRHSSRSASALLFLAICTVLLAGCSSGSMPAAMPLGPSPLSSTGTFAVQSALPAAGTGSGLSALLSARRGNDNAELQVEGLIVAATGACPARSLTVGTGTTAVRTSVLTEFQSGVCEDLIVGARIHARGQRALDGSVGATRVQIQEPAHQDNSHAQDGMEKTVGTVTLASGACPTRTLTVGTGHVVVNTTVTTTYNGGTCADLTVAARVKVTGSLSLDGSIEATRIDLKTAGDNDLADGEADDEADDNGLDAAATLP
jgi:ferredoxin